ncbi:acyltransferase [Thermodesulfobacteriota bacterium]
MIKFIPGPVRGGLSLLLMLINTVFWSLPLYAVAILKLVIPINPWRNLCGRILVVIATTWISLNNLNLRLTNDIEWNVEGVDDLEREEWYLVLANHQTWADIIVLQKVFNKKIPFLKFFIKKELLWVPFLGLAWWALDYPIMKRYSKKFVEENPHLKGKDIETTRRACEKFKTMPVSIMNFVEGTRFTETKRAKQNSPYKNLLIPRAAGIATVLAVIGDKIHYVVDATIHYPEGVRSFWQFLCGGVPQVTVMVRSFPSSSVERGDYFDDEQYRERFKAWINALWEEKDRRLEQMNQR